MTFICFKPAGRRNAKTAVAREESTVRSLRGEEALAGQREIERAAGWLESALREVSPGPFHHGKGTELAHDFVSIAVAVQSVRFAVRFEARGGRIRKVVREHVER